MKVLMFGWEFPPFNSGGLGTACYGLTRALASNGAQVTLVLPKAHAGVSADFVKILAAELGIIEVDSLLRPYLTSKAYSGLQRLEPGIYGSTLFEEVRRYSEAAWQAAMREDFDVIHSHDWMTMGAAFRAREATGKPWVAHIHATEFDRTGGHPNQYVYEIERRGMQKADHVIAVSEFTKNMIVTHYGIGPDKITVVHNAVDFAPKQPEPEMSKLKENDRIVLFLGRITLQKGPDYFVYAARKVLEHEKNVKFVVAGSGDMEPMIIRKAAELGIADHVLFAGFLRGADVDRAYKMADVYVMPSVSEPFGITPLEAMRNNTPVIISKQSGVSEVISHCLKVDFWDVNEIANKIISVLRYKELKDELRANASREVLKFDWNVPAKKVIDVYNKIVVKVRA